MSTSSKTTRWDADATRALRLWADERRVWLELADGRVIGFPAANFRQLDGATDVQLAKGRIRSEGTALRWNELDEDLTVEGILAGRWLPPRGTKRRSAVAARTRNGAVRASAKTQGAVKKATKSRPKKRMQPR